MILSRGGSPRPNLLNQNTVMKKIYTRHLLLVYAFLLLLQICGVSTQGQQQNQDAPPPPQQEQADDEVIRISTDLVQTGVSVFDKQGRFVEGLKKEDFELKVDGRAVEVGFFERVAAGSVAEESQLAAPRGAGGDAREKATDTVKETVAAKPVERGRVIIFFVDDTHMAPDSLKRAKDDIVRFIDKEMGQNDLVAITSPSGQVGFLQQYTNNKDVLKTAVSRLTYRNYATRDNEAPPMTDGQAMLINQGDKAVTEYFVLETVRLWNVPLPKAREIVAQRARILLEQSRALSKATLSALEALSRRAAGLPGRKLVFFISDGFPMDARNSDTLDRLRHIVDASIRSGVMIYTMDARGLVTDMMDATTETMPTGSVALATRVIGEDILNRLAEDTGGRFIHNTNVLGPEVTKALSETSVYYLLAWRPAEVVSDKKFRRIEVSVKNRPELSVRVQRGYFENPSEAKQKDATSAKQSAPVDPLRKAINSLFPKREIPTGLALTYMDTPAIGSTLVVSMKVESGSLKFEQPSGSQSAAVVDIAGTIFDAKGKALDSFNQRLTVTPPPSSASGTRPRDIIYNYRATLKPGLYQVRVAAVDRASGQTGSAAEWVEIPDISRQGFSMSSIIVGERKPSASGEKADALAEGVMVSVDRRFERSSNLRYLVYIYNAARSGAASANARPDVTLQVQIFRNNQLVVSMPPRQPSTESQDPTHLAYAAEIPLEGLRTGQYVMQVTAIDNISKASASQRVRFEVQ
ncbi:MAG TPA: VWA domain-containing protein [Pyrinomonadaceae bacterium]|nr:VWA domain-containing protein [Pyrinomonadaceae bacterium]